MFWSLTVENRHRTSIGVNPALDTLRARIFLHAVELHRLTIVANAKMFLGNLRVVSGMLRGTNRDKLVPTDRSLLWDALFFVVPVVSTTLASFDRLFAGMEQESLGWVLIDEAGQATPQSAAGAIWRGQRAVLIGDPLQIEPVFTVPSHLVNDFSKRCQVSSLWSPAQESVQTLADRVTPLGSWVSKNGSDTTQDQGIWTGMPLCTHRRCDDPMFSVSNHIAYSGQMVQGRVDEKGFPRPSPFSCVLGQSTWFDVRSTDAVHPVVKEEIDVLIDCLQKLRRNPAFVVSTEAAAPPKRAKIYVIRPFRKVKDACQKALERTGLKNVECGTVHTFQGKEAEVVFLCSVLPQAKQAQVPERGPRRSQTVNVAVTRAKFRLYVIGNKANWGALDYFSTLCSEFQLHAATDSGNELYCGVRGDT